MSFAEAWDLAEALSKDTSSHLCASLNGWLYPFSQEAIVLADLYDLTLAANVDKKERRSLKPRPRPFESKNVGRSNKPTVSQAEIMAALKARGH